MLRREFEPLRNWKQARAFPIVWKYNSGNPQPFPFPWLWESEHLASMAKIPRKEEEGFFPAFHRLFHLGSVSSLDGASFLPLDKRKRRGNVFLEPNLYFACLQPTMNPKMKMKKIENALHIKDPLVYIYFYASLCSLSLFYVQIRKRWILT